jgi:hypothetical protein
VFSAFNLVLTWKANEDIQDKSEYFFIFLERIIAAMGDIPSKTTDHWQPLDIPSVIS